MKVRHDFFIFCKEALQGLTLHARGKNITVDIEFNWSKILLKILCVGAEADEGTSGLKELRKSLESNAAAMQANLAFEAGKKDAAIVLVIPVKANAFTVYNIFGNKR